MAKTHIYTVRSGKNPGAYTISKMTQDFEPVAEYHLSDEPSGSVYCDCPAHKPWCRHKDMLRKFQAEEKVNSGWFYDHDKEKWIPPLSAAEEAN